MRFEESALDHALDRHVIKQHTGGRSQTRSLWHDMQEAEVLMGRRGRRGRRRWRGRLLVELLKIAEAPRGELSEVELLDQRRSRLVRRLPIDGFTKLLPRDAGRLEAGDFSTT